MTNNPDVIDLENIVDQQRLAESILIDIDDYCDDTYGNEGHRNHLGGSLIGRPCARQLFYTFRWAKKPDFNSYDAEGNVTKTSGQTLRLFQRGHKEEVSFTEYLQGIGCVLEATPDSQIRISDVGGHFGGSLDNVGLLPARYAIYERFLFEFKTANMSNFNKLKNKRKKNASKGIVEPIFPSVFPEYWSQVCVYGYKAGIKYVFFMIVDKNTDALWIEIVKIDWEHGKTMIDKAGMIIQATNPPPKISLHPTHLSCKWCNFKGICFDKEPMEKNCRSCVNATAVDEKKWTCSLVNQVIPDHVITEGCPQWSQLVSLG